MGTGLKGRLRRLGELLSETQEERDAAELAARCADRGATALTSCRLGQVVSVAGTIRCVRLAPLAGTPTFEVDVFDGSGTVRLSFLGRRSVRGLEAGRALVATGRLTRREGRMTLFNPRYELLAPERG